MADTKNDAQAPIEPKRERWSSRTEFVLATIGNCVGVGNVWRFPYLCYKNGGGTFLVPYIIALCVIGVPIFLIELAVGQRFAKGSVYAYRALDTRLGGVGVASTCMAYVTLMYYNIIVAWTIVYMAQSCRSVNRVPWRGGRSGVDAERFWDHAVLWKSEGFDRFEDDFASVQLVGASVVAWSALFFATRHGVQSTGKVAYVSATLPYVLLMLLVIRGATLEGASNGLVFYLKPKPRRLLAWSPWLDAANQIIYSLGVGTGGLVAFGSYNAPDEDVVLDSFCIAALNSATSLFAGVAIFAMLGHKARVDGETVGDVVDSGEGLAFVAYPDGLSKLPGAGVWCFIFFAMLFALALDSSMAMLEAFMTMLIDFGLCDSEDGSLNESKRQRVVLLCCLFGFCVSLLFVTRPGIYWFALIDSVVVWGVFAVAAIECLAVSKSYGGERFAREILQNTHRAIPNVLTKYCWPLITPALCTILGLASLAVTLADTRPKYEGARAPTIARAFALVIMMAPLVVMGAGAVFPKAADWKPVATYCRLPQLANGAKLSRRQQATELLSTAHASATHDNEKCPSTLELQSMSSTATPSEDYRLGGAALVNGSDERGNPSAAVV